jgi:SAM-dependent methyltransferase
LAVTATDVVPAMLRLTHQRATAARVDGCVELASSDAHQLTFPNETFDVVVTLGVLPWLHTPRQAVQEIARVLRPGGHLIANVDNLWRLSDLLDPRLNPFLGRARRAVRGALIRAGLVRPRSGVRYKSHSIAEFDRLLGSLDFELEASRCYGFGPFTIFGQRLMPDHLDVAVHRGLQALADRGTPGLRSTGGVYMVLARKRLAA